MFVSIVMPAKDEPDRALLEDLARQLRAIPCELLIQKEKGISNAVWHGLRRATGDVVAIMDGDGTHSAFDLRMMLAALREQEADLVVASRHFDCYPWHRRQITKVANWLARNWLGLPYRDLMTAFLVGNRETIRFEPSKSCKFGLEILCNIDDTEKVVEFPISRMLKEGHKSHMNWKEGFYLIWQLMRLKLEK